MMAVFLTAIWAVIVYTFDGLALRVEGVKSVTLILQPEMNSAMGANRQMNQFLWVDLDAEVSMILSRRLN